MTTDTAFAVPHESRDKTSLTGPEYALTACGPGMCDATTTGMLMPNVDRYMTREPYSVVSTDAMDQRKADCVVVNGRDGVEGIFPAMDAFAALTDLLRRATTGTQNLRAPSKETS